MKTLQVARDILPIGSFKVQAARVIRDLQASGRPVVITRNGRPAAVLVAPADFDRMNDRARFVAAVQAGLEDADAGRTVDDATLTRELDAEFGRPPRAR